MVEELGKPFEDAVNVLLVDDERNILSSLTRLLAPLKYTLYQAISAAEGIQILESKPVDIVISDMKMPGMDGAEFLRVVHERWPKTVRILLTGHSDLGSTIRAINSGGIYRYISKPWEDTDLKVAIRNAAQHKRLEDLANKQTRELAELNLSLERKVEQRTEKLNLAQNHLRENLKNSIKLLSSLIESRLGIPEDVARKDAELAYEIALGLGMSKEQAQSVLFAALLRNVGKLVLKDRLIDTPLTKLSTDELSELRQHPVLAQSLLMSLSYLKEAGEFIRFQNEYLDGSGHPAKLKGDAIPLGARILCVINDYGELKAGGTVGKEVSSGSAQRFIEKYAGIRYDERVVNMFLEKQNFKKKFMATSNPVKVVSLKELKPGMRLAEDVFNPGAGGGKKGFCLLPRGHVVDEDAISKLILLEQISGETIRVQVEDAERMKHTGS